MKRVLDDGVQHKRTQHVFNEVALSLQCPSRSSQRRRGRLESSLTTQQQQEPTESKCIHSSPSPAPRRERVAYSVSSISSAETQARPLRRNKRWQAEQRATRNRSQNSASTVAGVGSHDTVGHNNSNRTGCTSIAIIAFPFLLLLPRANNGFQFCPVDCCRTLPTSTKSKSVANGRCAC